MIMVKERQKSDNNISGATLVEVTIIISLDVERKIEDNVEQVVGAMR